MSDSQTGRLGVTLLALSLLAGLSACRAEATATAPPAASMATSAVSAEAGSPEPKPTNDFSHIPDCQTPKTEALGMGLSSYDSEAASREALSGIMPFPDPATLPEGSEWVEGYYNASMVEGSFKQSTMGLAYRLGPAAEAEEEGSEPEAEDEAGSEERFVQILYYSTIWPFVEPQEPHETVEFRGTTAYLFQPPFREGMHSLWWLDGCRQISVIGDMTRDELFTIAEGLVWPADAAR